MIKARFVGGIYGSSVRYIEDPVPIISIPIIPTVCSSEPIQDEMSFKLEEYQKTTITAGDKKFFVYRKLDLSIEEAIEQILFMEWAKDNG